jgi:ABC-type transport system involved in multi-copper enzyme maturation permease subunit
MRFSLATALGRGWFRLFGPVLFYDLVRLARRNRYIILRCLYAGILAAILYWLYYQTFLTTSPVLPTRPTVTPRPWRSLQAIQIARPTNRVLMTSFAEQFFNWFMILQFGLVLVLTPVYAATCLTEEKERKTLEYLLATDLSDREIVLSKLLSRLANLALIVAAGLPILSVVQFLGGVDPDLVLAGFAATGVTMASITSVSVLASVYCRKSRNAILVTYVILIAYMGAGYLLAQLQKTPLAAGMGPPPGMDTLTLFNAGNLPVVLDDLRSRWIAGTSLPTLVAALLRSYLIFHAGLTGACTLWAVWRLRKITLEQSTRQRALASVLPRPRIRPRLALQPMTWKEVFVEPVYRPRRLGWIIVGLLVIISLAPAPWIYAHQYLEKWFQSGGALNWRLNWFQGDPEEWNLWARVVSTLLGSFMLMAVAARASTSISGERDRDTLDALLAAPLRSHDILFGKWLGSVLSIRWAWLWLGTIWLIGIATGGLHPLAVPLSLIAWLVYASFLAGMGLWFSTVCRTSLRAMFYTLGATVVLYGGCYVGAWALYFFLLPYPGVRWLAEVLTGIQSAFTPPVVLYWVGIAPREVNDLGWEIKVLTAFFGLFLWAFAALFLWTITRSRFRRITSRMPYHRGGPRSVLVVDSWGPTGREEVLQGSA